MRKSNKLIDLLAAAELKPELSIDEFCARHHMCRQTYYNIKRAGRGPKETKRGRRRTITREAEQEWMRDAEQNGIPSRPRAEAAR